MTTGATDPRVRRLAQEISGIKQRLNALSLTPQLASSSIEDGAVTAYDRDGQLTMVVGKQHDGTHAPNVVTGPTPDAPAGLTVAGGQMSVTATWDGSWSGGGVAPMDLARIEVHVTEAAVALPDPGFDSATRVGTIETAAGASLTFAAQQGEAWVWLIARTLPGKASEPSGPAKADVSGAVDPAMFEQASTDLAGARARLDAWAAELADVQGNVTAASVAARTGSFIQLDAGQLTVTGSTNLSEAVAQKFFANIFAANKITGNEVNAQSVAGVVGDFVNVKAENIKAGFITAGIAFSTGSFVAGQIFGKCAQMNANGFSTLQVAEDGTQYVSTTLGTPNGTDSLAVFNAPNKPPVFEVSSDGAVSAADLAVEDDPTIAGRPLLGKTLDNASAETGWIDDLPKGIIGRGSLRPLVSSKSVTNGFQDLGTMTFTIQPGRSYRITLPYAYVPTLSSGAQAQASLIAFYTLGTTATPQPADPTRSSGRLGQSSKQITLSTTSYPVTDVLSFVFDAVNTVPVEMKIMFSAFAGPNLTMGYSVADNTTWVAFIEDVGTSVPDTARLSTAASISTYTTTWVAGDSRSYNGNGSADTYGNDRNVLRHGQYLAANGNLRSAVIFPYNGVSGEAKTMATALSGATVTKAEIYVESLHWAASTGGTARFFPMTGGTLPQTLASIPGTPISKRFTSRAQGFWLQVPTSWFSASNRGFIIGPAADTTQTNYGYFPGHAHSKSTARPKVRLTYTR